MSRRIIFIVLAGLAVLLAATSTCWAIYVQTHTEVWTSGSKTHEDSDSATGAFYATCSSHSQNTYVTQSGASATAWWGNNGFQATLRPWGDVPPTRYGLDSTSQWAKAYPFGLLRAIINGVDASVELAFEPIVDLGISTGNSGSITAGFDLQIDESSVLFGAATLDFEGNLSGSGLYDPSNFSASTLIDDMWQASYIGGPVGVDFPVDSFFDIFFEVTVDEVDCFGSDTIHEIGTVLPDGYELVFVPEPASFLSLLIPSGGLALLLRRRR